MPATDAPAARAPYPALRSTPIRGLALTAIAVLAGLGVGRFLTYDGGSGQASAAGVGARTPAARLASLERAVDDRPNDPRAWQALGSTYVRLAIATGDPDYFGGAERALARATELDPRSPVTLVAKGTFALTLHQFTDALRFGEEAEAIDPFNPEAKAVRVDALVELGRYDEASSVLQELLDLRPGLAALTRVSYLRQLSGDLDGALGAMQQARTAAAGQTFESAVASALEGEIHLLRGELELADTSFTRALKLSPGLVAGELGRARSLEATGRRADAVTGLRRALDQTGAPGLATLLGELLDADGRAAAATAAYDEARQVYRDEITAGAVVDLEVAYLEADHGPPPVALDSARRAYEARPNIYTADAMAWALQRSGRSTDAVAFAEESLRHGTLDAALRVHAASVFLASGMVDRANAAIAPVLARPGYLQPALRPAAQQLLAGLGADLPFIWRRAT